MGPLWDEDMRLDNATIGGCGGGVGRGGLNSGQAGLLEGGAEVGYGFGGASRTKRATGCEDGTVCFAEPRVSTRCGNVDG